MLQQLCSYTLFVNSWCFLEEWIGRGDQHTILLDHAAAIGYEQIYRRLFEHFHMKVRESWPISHFLDFAVLNSTESLVSFEQVHINQSKFEEYENVGNIQAFTTPDANETKIHACKPRVSWKNGSTFHRLVSYHSAYVLLLSLFSVPWFKVESQFERSGCAQWPSHKMLAKTSTW